jgi:hypothetical protein
LAVVSLTLLFVAAAARAALFDPADGLWRGRSTDSHALSFEVHEGRIENVRFTFSWGFCGKFESALLPNAVAIRDDGSWVYNDGRGPKVEANFIADDRVEGIVFAPSRELPSCPETEAHFIAAPGEALPPPEVVDTTAPTISGVRVRVDQGRAYYRLSEQAKVELLLEVRRPGRVVGQNCLAVSRANRDNRPCSLWLPRGGMFKGPGGSGRHSARIPAGAYLPPGAYRLTMTATDPAGNVAAARRRFAVRG